MWKSHSNARAARKRVAGIPSVVDEMRIWLEREVRGRKGETEREQDIVLVLRPGYKDK